MKRFLYSVFIGVLLCISFSSFAQYKVTFEVKQPSLLHSMDNLYIAGSLNLWNPGDKSYQLVNDKRGVFSITLSLAKGNYEYKITRGSWIKEETNAEGKGISNRTFSLHADTTIIINIAAWNDDFKSNIVSSAKKHTASVNVKIMDSAFYIPELQRSRRIWVYLPPEYSSSKKKYPVLYMHDGQNLFDNFTSYAGEWGVDEYLDSIFKSGQKEVIVVGIDNGPKRMNEYNPWQFQDLGKGEGDLYVDFLVKNLKPSIDKNYRTLKDKPNTFIAGSSMGGLISLYAILKYPQVFGGGGIFSPAFWTASGIDSTTLADSKQMNSKLFFYAGGKEGDSMIPDMQKIEKEIREHSQSHVKEMIDPDARHNEAAWRKYFPFFYEWVIEGKN